MNYHNITTEDMLNGDGLRTVLWVSGCDHCCKGCQNPETWDACSGIPFDDEAEFELMESLKPDYISGITFSGGDPLFPGNRETVGRLIERIKKELPNKTVWLYTGFVFEEIKDLPFISLIDVICDGEFDLAHRDVKLHWVGSPNQRVIDVQATLKTGTIVLHEKMLK